MQAMKVQWLLVALMSFQQLFKQADAATLRDENDGITLAFVIDSTSSMRKEINQVKGAVVEIFDYLRNERNDVENFALVEFNDPKAKLLTVTNDSIAYKKHLENIKVHGGGDCPEMSMTGLEIALNNSLPHSNIFLFTDATAKDYYKKPILENIIQRKRVKIIFVLTGGCGNDKKGSEVYHQLAEICNGHVFTIQKGNNEMLNQVLQFVKVDTGKKSIIASEIIPEGESVKILMVVDVTVKEITVLVTGKSPSVNITDPTGKSVGTVILTLNTVKAKQVKTPISGNYTVEVKTITGGRYTVTAETNLTLTIGFSLKPSEDLAETSPRPMEGMENEMLIAVNDIYANIIQLTEVRIKDEHLNTKQTIELQEISGKNGVFKTKEKFVPLPLFFVQVVGTDSYNTSIKRVSDTSFSPQMPGPPIITLEEELTASLKYPFSLICHVESHIPFSGTWKRNTTTVCEDEFQQSANFIYHIKITTSSDAGLYTCTAENKAGVASQQLELKVKGNVPKVINIINDEESMIPCTVEQDHTYKWEKQTSTGEFKEVDESKFITPEGNLLILSTKMEDAGTYKCSLISKHGTAESKVEVVVQ